MAIDNKELTGDGRCRASLRHCNQNRPSWFCQNRCHDKADPDANEGLRLRGPAGKGVLISPG